MSANNKFTQKEIDFIRENFADMKIRELAAALGRSEGGVKTWKLKLGLRRSIRFDWTPERTEILIGMYPNNSAKEISAVLETNDYVIYKKAERLKLKKTPEYLAELNKQMGENLQINGHATRFEKGHKPWCSGKKVGTKGRTAETQFKKSQMPHNHLPVGSIRKPSGYWKIKIAEPNQWEFLHIYNWQNAYGDVPKGMCITFKDGISENSDIENLEMVTRKELSRRNSIHALPDELKQTIRTLGRLKKAIKRSLKNAEEQN